MTKIIISAFWEQFGSTFEPSRTSYPRVIRWATYLVGIVFFFLMRPLYGQSDLSALSIATASFAFAWLVILATSDHKLSVPRGATTKMTEVLYKVFERVREEFLQPQSTEDFDIRSKEHEISDYLQRLLERFIALLIPGSLWDSIFIVVFSILAVITNHFPQRVSLGNYSFATAFLAASSTLVLRVCIMIAAIVYYRTLLIAIEVDEIDEKPSTPPESKDDKPLNSDD